MLQSTNFTFNNINSDDKGVVLVNTSSGLFQDIFLPNRTLVQSKVPYGKYSVLKRVEKDLPPLPLTFFVENWRTWNNLRDIVRWLDVDEYCEFWTQSDPERIYYFTVEGASQLLHNGAKDGYFTLNFKSLYPYALSPVYTVIGEARTGQPYLVNLDNSGDESIRPFITITKIGDGDIAIRNLKNGQNLIITGLYNNETVYIDCENEIIKSSLEESNNRYLFNNHNGVWLDFDTQVDFTNNQFSEFEFVGNYDFHFEYRLIYKNETR